MKISRFFFALVLVPFLSSCACAAKPEPTLKTNLELVQDKMVEKRIKLNALMQTLGALENRATEAKIESYKVSGELRVLEELKNKLAGTEPVKVKVVTRDITASNNPAKDSK